MQIFSKDLLMASGGGETEFVRPDLTSNGTMGGNAFAVQAEFGTSYAVEAYKAVDGSSATYWYSGIISGSRTYYWFYNPQALKISKITVYCTNYDAQLVELAGRNTTTEAAESISGTFRSGYLVGTFTVTTPQKFYKYHQLYITPSRGSIVQIKDIEIEATYKG